MGGDDMTEYETKLLENIERNTQNAEDLLRSIDSTLGDALVSQPGELSALERIAATVEKISAQLKPAAPVVPSIRLPEARAALAGARRALDEIEKLQGMFG